MGSIIDRALDIINDHLKDQTSSFSDPVTVKPMARGGHVLEDDYPTHYLPNVGRQVMAKGGTTKKGFEGRVSKPKPAGPTSWEEVPTINPNNLVGKKIFPIFADLTKTGDPFMGIDASQLEKGVPMRGGPGYPLIPENVQHGIAWAVEGKGRGTAKLGKDADYAVVMAMNPDTHRSNASFSRAIIGNMQAYARDGRLEPENLEKLNELVREPGTQKELQSLREFPGFEHPDAVDFIDGLSFEARKKLTDVLGSPTGQKLGAPNISKIIRETADPQFAGVDRSAGLFLMELHPEKGLSHLKEEGLLEHESYTYGVPGRIVGKFHHPVAAEMLFKDFFDKKHAEAQQAAAEGKKTNVRRAFDLAMPVGEITQEIADMLPRAPKDIQSSQAARLALNVLHDRWHTSDDPVKEGGVSAADFSQALKDSDASSTLTQYSQKELNDMTKSGKFKAFKLKDGQVYFGLKKGTDYKDEYGFEHPELTPNETSLVSVVNNEPGAKGIGGAPVVLKAIEHGATALDAFAVPSKKHPNGFLPDFYSTFGFKELGRVPFDPKYVSEQQLADMKHHWTKNGWDESMGLPSLAIMKWTGTDDDRKDALRRHLQKSSASDRQGANPVDVLSAAGATESGASAVGGESGLGGEGVGRLDRGPIRDDRGARAPDRLSRTLTAVRGLTPTEAPHFGLTPEDVTQAQTAFEPPAKAYGGGINPIENRIDDLDDLGRRLILWSYAAAPMFGRAEGGRTYPVAMTSDAEKEGLERMPPEDFLEKARELSIEHGDRQLIDSFKRHIKRGDPLGPLKLYADGKEDGRHRATAAKELGIKNVPVINYRHKADGGPVDDAHNAVDVARNLTPMGFYSAAAEAASKIPQRAPIDQILNKLKGSPNVKAEELDLSGVRNAFAGQKSVDPKDVAAHLQENLPQIYESVYGYDSKSKRQTNMSPKYERYTFPGGQNYREVVLHDPFAEGSYQSPHWLDPNVIAHLRMADRGMYGLGEPEALHIEEVQSDWGQEGRDAGFREPVKPQSMSQWVKQKYPDRFYDAQRLEQKLSDERFPRLTNDEHELMQEYELSQNEDKSLPPKGPHVTSTEGWTDLALKRALMEAAKGKYKKLTWTPGEDQADRYGLDKSYSQIHYSPDTKELFAKGKDGVEDIQERVHPDALHSFIGKELAKKLLDRPLLDNTQPGIKGEKIHSLIGGQLSVEQKGMRDYYDRFLPNRLQKLVSKLDPEAKVQLFGHKIYVPGEEDPEDGEYKKVHSLEITPKLRAAILKGLPAYDHGGSVLKRAFKVLSQYS